MQSSELAAPPCAPLLPQQAPDAPSEARQAPWVLGAVLVLGALTQALFWNAGLGVDWLVWDVAMVTLTLALLRRPRLKPTVVVAASACVLFGVAIVLHRSAFTTTVALPCNVAALLALPLIVSEDLGFDELASLPRRMLGLFERAPSSMVHTLFLPSEVVAGLDVRARGVAKGGLVGLALGTPAAGLFALLLTADPGFAATLDRLHARLGSALTFCAYAAITAGVYALVHAIFVRWDPTDASPGPAIAAPYRLQEPSSSLASHVSPLTWGMVVGQVAAVFGVFVVVHVDTEFGGHSLVRDRSGITYASHLHAGFYQLLLATLLSVCLVLVGHGLLRTRVMPQAKDTTIAVPGGSILSALESALLVLTGLTLASCMQRLKLYEEAYGATHLRLGVAFIGLAVGGLLLCTLAKAIFRAFRGFVGTAFATLTACALAASAFDADAYVARTNLDRVSRGASLDEAYLATLSADACAVVDHPALSDPALRARLIQAWSIGETTRDVRAFRGLTRCPPSGSP